MNKETIIKNFLMEVIRAQKITPYDLYFEYSGNVNKIYFRISKKTTHNSILSDSVAIQGKLYKEEIFFKKINYWIEEINKNKITKK